MNSNSNVANGSAHHRDDVASKMGMWLFLFTEILLFGGLFLIYAVYRYQYSGEFHLAAIEINTTMGALNTVILITSSLTVALSVIYMQKGNRFLSLIFLMITNLFALMFLVNKYFEWSDKASHGIFPGMETLLAKSNGEIMYFGLYYIMTGLHTLHVVIGIVYFMFIISFIMKQKITPTNNVKLENAGLYWHLVDLIWIFLFPLFYLIK